MHRFVLLIVVVSHFAVVLGQTAVEMPDPEVDKHRLAIPALSFRLTQDYSWPPWVRLKIVVAPDGAVTSAESREGNPRYFDAAARAVRNWSYKPFLREGKPVTATFTEHVKIVPPERRPTKHVAFPKIRDWKSLQITLQRTGCFGTCPAYSLHVMGNGTVHYTGRAYVHLCGDWTGEISPDSVRRLVDEFRKVDYFSLFPRYMSGQEDLPHYATAIEFDGKKMFVLDDVDEDVGMPLAVISLEDSIDQIAGPEKWLNRTQLPPNVEECGAEKPASDVSSPTAPLLIRSPENP